MKGKYLIVNAGSSSVKFSLYSVPDAIVIVQGVVERIGKDNCTWTFKNDSGKEKGTGYIKDHLGALKMIMKELLDKKYIDSMADIKAVGHRVLHGATIYAKSVLIDQEVIENIEKLTPFGPLHHPGQLAGIRCIETLLPNVPMVATFDTAFHQTMPPENYMYPVPFDWYTEDGVRRYGFHGTSHRYITEFMQKLLGTKHVNIISCHIGSGASITAIKDGKCYDTTMGLTPLDGLMMGTRSGGIDPSIIDYIAQKRQKSIEEVINDLNKKSGLFGITGKNDYRDICELIKAGDERAILANKMFVNSVATYIMKYFGELDGDVDGIVFTAGIGENSYEFRRDVVEKISKPLQLNLNNSVNDNIGGGKKLDSGIITTSNSKIPIYVIPTDEELIILQDTINLTKDLVKDKQKGL